MILKLPEGTILGIDLVKQECRVQCREGLIWITRTGDRRDHMIEAGEEYVWKGTGKIVIEAVRPSCAFIHADSPLAMNVTGVEAADGASHTDIRRCCEERRPLCDRFSCCALLP